MTPRRGERGSAAVLTTVLAGVLLVVALVGSAAAGLLVGQRRAAAAADLAALAGADLLTGPGTAVSGSRSGAACARAVETAVANGAVLSGCRQVGPDLTVSVTVEVTGPWGLTWPVSGVARAGPATASGGRGP